MDDNLIVMIAALAFFVGYLAGNARALYWHKRIVKVWKEIAKFNKEQSDHFWRLYAEKRE